MVIFLTVLVEYSASPMATKYAGAVVLSSGDSGLLSGPSG